MSDPHENTLPLVVQDLRHIQSASHVLAECLTRFGDEPETDKALQMDRLYGVAYLLGLVSQQVDQAQLLLKQEIAAR